MTRIVAGSAGGRRIRTLPGDATRPTGERVREALFSTLMSALGDVAGTRFLDLYAGSGAVGLEALSRGAAAAVLVEHDRRAAATIWRNARELGLVGATVVSESVLSYLQRPPPSPFDIVFCDPPYALPGPDVAAVVAHLVERSWVARGGVIVVERAKRDPLPAWPAGVEELQRRRYGDTLLWYGRRSVDPAADAPGD